MTELIVGAVYRARPGPEWPAVTTGMPLLLAAVVPGAHGFEAVLSALTAQGRVEYRLPAARARELLEPPPMPPEEAAAKHCGVADWPALLTALRAGQRFTIPVPPNGDSGIESFTRWFSLLEQHRLCMIATPENGTAVLGLVTSFSREELDAAANRVARFAAQVRKETPPWVKNGQIDPSYLP